ncbi:MAG: tetratricopeptide repeat protein [Spirochaetia bacterium]|nr:tetratricopeptide repeat protein [Spirochaetia bacterium]
MVIYILLMMLFFVLIGLIFILQKTPERIDRAVKALKSGEYEMARSLLDIELKKNRRNTRANFYMAQCYEKLNRHNDALKHYNEVKDSEEFDAEVDILLVLRKIANLYYSQEKMNEAFESYLEILKLYPDDIDANSHLGFMALGQKEFKISQPFLKKCVHLDIENKQFQLAFMTGLFEGGQEKKAFDIIRNLLEEDQNNLELNIYFIIMCQHDNFEEGIERIEDIVFSIKDNNFITLLIRLYVFISYKLEKTENIASFIKKVKEKIELSEELKLETEYYLMLSLLKNIALEEARKIYQKIIKTKPNYKDMQKITSFTGFNTEFGLPQELDKNINEIFENTALKIIPKNILFSVLGLKTTEKIEFAKYFDLIEGMPILKDDYKALPVENLFKKYVSLDSAQFQRFAEKTVNYYNQNIIKKLKSSEKDGIDILAKNKHNASIRTLFFFRRWPEDANISDVFLNNLMNKVTEIKAIDGILISNGKLTVEAQKKISSMKKITILDEKILSKIMRTFL